MMNSSPGQMTDIWALERLILTAVGSVSTVLRLIVLSNG
jgi:hypothetical protein